MRIKQDTPARLVLEDRPWVMSGFLAAMTLGLATGAVFSLPEDITAALGLTLGAAFMGLVFALFLRRTIVILDRAAGAMVWREATLRGQTERHTPLAAIRGAVVQTHRSRNRAGEETGTARVALQIEGASLMPLTMVYSAGPGAERAAAAITRWLGQTDAGP